MESSQHKTSPAERQVKLALFVAAKGPVSRQQVQAAIPEYAAGPGASAEGAHRAREAARRRFERDKSELAAQGVRLESGEDGLYRLAPPGAEGPLAQLEPGSPQAALLRVAGVAPLQDPSCLQASALRMALAKLCGPLEIPDALEWAGEESLLSIVSPKPLRGTTRRKVGSALVHRKRLSFDYVDAAGRSSRRCVEGIGLYSAKGREYLAAWDTAREDKRCFRLDRMSNVSVAGNGRGKPDYEPRPFNAQDWQLLGFQMGPGPAHEALVKVSPSALWQARNLCAGHGELLKDEIGRVSWRVSYANARELASWCVANGPGLIPVRPQEVADEYAQLIAEAQRWGGASERTAQGQPPAGRPAIEQGELEALLWGESEPQPAGTPGELARFAEELAQAFLLPAAAEEPQEGQPEPGLREADTLLALLCMLEEAGRVSLPQASKLLGLPEEQVYSALVTLVFCYDTAGLRLELGDPGCSFATLRSPAGLRPELTAAESRALASAAAAITAGSVAGTLAAACAQECPATLEISYWKEGAPAPEQRVVEPQALLEQQDHTYLQAWCRSAGDRRLFRLDRILSARCLPEEEPAARSAHAHEEQPWQRARIALAKGTRVPSWPGLELSKKQARSGDIGLSLPWYGGPWLPKQLASLGAQVLRIHPPQLAWAACSYAESLQEELEHGEE